MMFKTFRGRTFSHPHREPWNLMGPHHPAVSTHPDKLVPEPSPIKKILNPPMTQSVSLSQI